MTARPSSSTQAPSRGRILLCGATGTIGAATADALLERGYALCCLSRRRPEPISGGHALSWQHCDFQDSAQLQSVMQGQEFAAVISCMASRSGIPEDAWAVDYQAHSQLLQAAQQAGVAQFVLLSAICVQKPRLAFQQAKLAFEEELISSGMDYSIVRPTAYFKSLAGQVQRVQQGRRYVVFGDGQLTACKPISDRDLAHYLVDCLELPEQQNRILPIGGPGPAQTPLEMGASLFALCGRTPRFTHVSPALLRGIGAGLECLAKLVPALAAKAELARIGHYYATESMLVWNEQVQAYDCAATPSTGSDTLEQYFAELVAGRAVLNRGAHSVF